MPFEESLVGKLEIFNEYTAMILLYHVFLFTGLVPSLTFQIAVGWSFVFFMCGNMSLHLYFLLKATVLDYKRKWTEFQKKRKDKKNLQAKQEEKKSWSTIKPRSRELLSQVDEEDES